MKRSCPSCGEEAVPLGAVFWAGGRLKPPAICGQCGLTCRPQLWGGMLAGVLADPLLLLVIGVVLAQYLNGYVVLTVMLLMIAILFASPLYVPLIVIEESERRKKFRRWLLLSVQAAFIAALVWLFVTAR